MSREGPRQFRAVRPPCAPHPLRAHPSRTVAPIPGPEPPVLVRKAQYADVSADLQCVGGVRRRRLGVVLITRLGFDLLGGIL